MYYKNEFDKIQDNLTSRTFVNYVLAVRSLINKLEEMEIEDSKLSEKFGVLAKALKRYIKGDNKARKATANSYTQVMTHAEKQHNLFLKGTLVSRYVGIFITVGIAMGSVLMTTLGVEYIGVGIALGAGLGAAIGSAKEKKAKDEGRLY